MQREENSVCWDPHFMRQAILIVVVLVLALIALVRPRTGLYAYIWFALMRPDYFAWAIGNFPFSPVLAGATLIGSIRYFPRLSVLFQNSMTWALLLFQIPIALSILFAINPALSYQPFFEFERIVMMSLLIPVLIESPEHLRNLFLVIVVSLGAVGLKFGLFGWRVGGVSISEGYAGLDNNGLALALVIALPFCWYASTLVESRWLKFLFLALVFCSSAAVIMTRSRAGSLAMATTFLLIVVRSHRKTALVIVLALLIGPSIYLVREQYFARMSTLKDPTADSSANSRLILSEAAIRMWKDHPVFGVGFGNLNYIEVLPAYISNSRYASLKVHNTYMQVLVDSGIFAFLIFLYLLFGTIVRLQRSLRCCPDEHPDWKVYPMALQTALIAIAQYGLTGGRERYDCLYFLLMASAAWLLMQPKLVLATESAIPESPVLARA
jgi:probable O-glycosylation ligase (exosortase A-associated)